MTEKSETRRPSQVTMAGWVALIGSLLMVVSLYEAVPTLQSVDFRNAVDEFLSTPPGSGLGIDTAQYVEFLRQLMVLSGAAGAVVAVFSVFVLQRHRAARVGLTVAAAAIMLLTAPFATAPMAELLPVSTSTVALPLAFAAILLWTRPARDWFAGRPVAQPRPAPAGRSNADPFAVHRPPRRVEGRLLASEGHPPRKEPDGEDTAPWPKMPEAGSGRPLPPPTEGFGTPPGQTSQYPGRPGRSGAPGQQPEQGSGPTPPQGQPHQQAGYPFPSPPYGEQLPYGQPPYGQPYGQQVPHGGYPPHYGQLPYGELPYGQPTQAQPPYGQPYYGARPSDANQRPTTVTIAAVITWIFSGLALIGLVITAAAIPTARAEIVRQLQNSPEFQQSGLSIDDVLALVWVIIAISFVWAVAAIVLAWFAFRRAGWARITLVISAAMTGLVSLMGVLGNPLLLVGLIAAGSVVALLFTGGANEWYSGRTAFQGYPGPFQPYGAAQQYGAPPGQSQQPPQYGAAPQYGAPPGQSQPPPQYGAPQYGAQPGHSQQPGQPGPLEPTGQSGQPAQYGGHAGQPGPAEQDRPEESRKRGKDEPPPNVW